MWSMQEIEERDNGGLRGVVIWEVKEAWSYGKLRGQVITWEIEGLRGRSQWEEPRCVPVLSTMG